MHDRPRTQYVGSWTSPWRSREARPHAGGGGGKECEARHERSNDWPQGARSAPPNPDNALARSAPPNPELGSTLGDITNNITKGPVHLVGLRVGVVFGLAWLGRLAF